MRHYGETEPSWQDEWLARVSPWLPADDPHQRCLRRAIDGHVPINDVCDCVHPWPCEKECCTSREDEWPV